MGSNSALALPQIVEILGPEGKYELGRAALRKEHGAIVVNSQTIAAINTPEEAEQATAYGRLLQVATKETEAFFKEIKQHIDAIKAPVLAAEKADIGPYEKEKLRLGAMQTAYNQKLKRELEEQRRKWQEESERQAREEALQRAVDLELQGDLEAAEHVLEEPIYAAPVVLQSSYTKPSGSVEKTTYRARVTDLMQLVKAVAEGKAPLLALEANESFLNNQASRFKEGFFMPGVELVTMESTHYRS